MRRARQHGAREFAAVPEALRTMSRRRATSTRTADDETADDERAYGVHGVRWGMPHGGGGETRVDCGGVG